MQNDNMESSNNKNNDKIDGSQPIDSVSVGDSQKAQETQAPSARYTFH